MARPAARRPGEQVRNGLWSALILVGVAAALLLGWLQPIDDAFAALRFRLVQRPASQTLTIVEIDSRSLAVAGAWPWSRDRYAKAIDNLVGAGATLVAFDVDFSTPSSADADQALAEAISRHPGQVALAGFVQTESYGARQPRLIENTPIAPLLADALLASVNVPVDPDGKVRHYDYTSALNQRPSVAALMAGATGRAGFQLDYGIDHRSIGHLSFEDVLQNRFDPAMVKGRNVLIGATALELGDEFATPSGLTPGVFLHGLAYESIVGGRALRTLHPLFLLVMCGGLAVLLLPCRDGGRGSRKLILRHIAVGVGIVMLPIAVQTISPVSLQLAPLLVTQLLFGIWATRIELSRRARAIVAEREAGLLHLAMHQPETGLPNRRALLQEIADAWAEQPNRPIAVITVGVERHAEMRGVVGYNVANSLIADLADRLGALAQAHCVAHLSTSVLAFSAIGLDADALKALLLQVEDLETNFRVEGHSIDIFLRIGAALQSDGPVRPEMVIERSTAALDQARRSNERVVIYDEATFGSPANNLALMSEMREAMASGDICLHYQPKMTLADGTITSVEALCRWRHPVRGFVPPDTFIPIAEETGQIRALTEWSVLQAMVDQTRLAARGHDVTIALNISGRLLADDAFKTKVLELTGSIATKLCFEITETAVIQSPALATDAIAAYRAAGVKISIDDYGSGLSSLGYLKMLDADELKIDKSLVVDVMNSQRDRLILKSTVDLAHGLGMSVVAEGVETEALAATLSLLGCDVIQGYWIAKPLPLQQLFDLLDKRSAVDDPQRAIRSDLERPLLGAGTG